MDFKSFYETRFPPELKTDFEAFLLGKDASKTYSEDMKFEIVTAFVAGYTANMRRKIDTRRKVMNSIDNHIEKLCDLPLQGRLKSP